MPPRQKWIRWLLPVAKLAVVVIVAWALHTTLAKALESLSHHSWHVQPPWLVLAGVLYLLGTLPQAIFYYQILATTGRGPKFLTTVRAFYISQLGKYVPGKAMVLILRAGMLRESLVPLGVLTSAIFFETLSTMAVGSLLAGLVFASQWPQKKAETAAALAMFVLMALPTVPVVLRWVTRLLGSARLSPAALAPLRRIGWKVLGMGWLLLAVGWVLQGAGLWAVLRGLDAVDTGPLADLPLHTAVVALSVVAGFISLIPGGFGIRDLASIGLLSPVYGDSMALVSTVILRLVCVVTEVLVSTILYLGRFLPRGHQETPAAPLQGEPCESRPKSSS